jgi:hypothetical protein
MIPSGETGVGYVDGSYTFLQKPAHGFGKVSDRLRSEDDVRRQVDPLALAKSGHGGHQGMKTSRMTGRLLGSAVKAQQNREFPGIQKLKNVLLEKTSIGRHGKKDAFFSAGIPMFDMRRQIFHQVIGQERLPAKKIEIGLFRQVRKDEINSLLSDVHIQIETGIFLIAVAAAKIAVRRQNEREI